MSDEDQLEEDTNDLATDKLDEMHLVPQDTPINKATLAELPGDMQIKFIETLQARRLKVREFKGKAKSSRDKAANQGNHAKVIKFDKLLEKLDKALETVDKNLTKAEQLVDELQIHRITMQEND